MKKIKRLKKRLLSMVLTFSMLLGMAPSFTAYAGEQNDASKSAGLWGDEYSWDDSSLWNDAEQDGENTDVSDSGDSGIFSDDTGEDFFNDDTSSGSLFEGESDNSLFEDGGTGEDLFETEENGGSLFESGESGSTDSTVTGDVTDSTDPGGEIPAGDVTLSAEDENIAVKITGSAEALMGIENVFIEDVTDPKASVYADYLNSLNDGWTYAVPGVYDIILTDKEGRRTEPNGIVSVSLSGYAVETSYYGRGELRIYHNELSGAYGGISLHIDEPAGSIPAESISGNSISGNSISENNIDDAVADNAVNILENSLNQISEEIPEEMKPFILSRMDSVMENTGEIVFMTDSFSDYALVLAGNDTQKEVVFGDNTYFETDKYLKKTGEMNGQDAYDIYLENAYYDDSQTRVHNYAPARTDIMLCIDQSASVAGYTDDYNEAIANLLKTIAKTNRDREQKARDGEYDDIDPDAVKVSDAAMVSAMKDHYMYVAGICGFNDHVYIRHTAYANPTLIRSEAEAAAIAAKAHVKHDYPEYCATGGAAATDQRDFTRTDLGTEKLLEWARGGHWNYTYNVDGETRTWNSLCCILITDGAPCGNDKNTYEETVAWPGTAMNAYPTNRALQAAYALKREIGAMNFGIYIPFHNTDDPSVIKAYQTGNIRDLIFKPNEDVITLAFLSLWSSDEPANGRFETVGGSHGTFTGNFNFYNSDAHGPVNNKFGRCTYADRTYPDLISYIDSFVSRIDKEAWSETNSRGYFGKDAVIQDEVTDPFEVLGRNDISVYAVPRVPVNLGADGIPTDMDSATKEVASLAWADSSEWVDITKDVDVGLTGNTVTVKGYDYEYNAVTDYDKDIVRYTTGDTRSNGLKYKAGDYGYKVVVVVPICAKFSFGGNGIRTNNEDTSGVIPGEPDEDNPNPPWEENNTLNPSHDKFIARYPNPEVDLKISYKIAKDDAVVYAPQTEELHDLLTDNVMNMIWYTDPEYFEFKQLKDAAKTLLDNANDRYDAAMKAVVENNTPAARVEVTEAEQAVIKATADYRTAQENLNGVVSYIPDGNNNAFVDISYEFLDPDGERLATMNIPHGKAYVTDENGTGNIDWSITTKGQVLDEEGKPIITKSGAYTVRAVVTPVDTTRSPDWHVYTEADDNSVKQTHPYSSTQYSSTGSSAAGSQSAVTVEEHPEGYVFTLKITAGDTRREPGQAIDFNIGSGALRDIVGRHTNIHIMDYEWICTDGVTESVEANEPGVTGLMKVGGDAMLTISIPKLAYDNGLVEDIAGVVTIEAENGGFVPADLLISRNVGNLNKSVDVSEQVEQRSMIMHDNDNIYGDGISSVEWVHECGIITKWNCNAAGQEFDQADKAYSDTEDVGHRGKVRYLMHVFENPEPVVDKITSTPVITAGSDINWTILMSNDDIERNESMNSSDFSMIDVLPWPGDGRIDPNYGADRSDGSRFSGTLYYKSMAVDFTDASHAKDIMSVYYTEDTAVRTAPEGELTGSVGGIAWTKVMPYSISETVNGYDIPGSAAAVRLDTKLEWEEAVSVNLTANIKDPADQQTGDYYHNAAWITQGRGTIIESNTVSTEVVKMYIAGTVWEDSDNNGLKINTEPGVAGVTVTLYKAYDEMNPNRIVRTVNGVDLSEAFDGDNNKFIPQITDRSGTYMFDNVQPGTYYIVADLIPERYNMTRQRAGAGNEQDAKIDSEAETELIASGEELEKTAWIKELTVTDASADYQNFGLQCIRGSIRVGKVVNEIYYPSAMTEEERNDYRIGNTFILRNPADGTEYRRTVYLKEDTIRLKMNRPQVWADFEDLPLGTYELTEQFDPNYHLSDVHYTSGNVSFDETTGITTVKITEDDSEIELWMENKARPDPPAGDENGVANPINIRTPVSLDVIYSGPDPVHSTEAYDYTFTASDFSGEGDIIVTYDDGSQIKLSDGSLRFDALTFSPPTLDSSMNSNKRRTTVTVYYAERGHMLRDSFNVRVDLKPFFKFKVRFHANTSTFDTGEDVNEVDFMYNELLGYNEVTSGIYKDVANGGMNNLDDFWQTGWNTSPNGMGTQYGNEDDALTPLNELGQDKLLNVLDLYANWQTNITFNANGGTLSGGSADWETAANGKGSVTGVYSKGQSIATGLIGQKSGYCFVAWNTKADGTGETLEDYTAAHGGCQCRVTFYAVYYKSEYGYTGSVQTFTVPADGWYRVEVYGSDGVYMKANYGHGGYTSGEFHFTAGTSLYVLVGGRPRGKSMGWNGGGCGAYHEPPYGGPSHNYPFSGAGATDVRLSSAGTGSTDWQTGLHDRIIVAGGAGGSDDVAHDSNYDDTLAGGNGGGLSGENGSRGAQGGTQTSGYAFGYGQSVTSSCYGAGGGGWYGGYASHKKSSGGGGGSGYLSGALGCITTGGYVARNGTTVTGGNGRDSDGYARFTMVEKD